MANVYAKRINSNFADKYYSAQGNSGQALMRQGAGFAQLGAQDKEKAQKLYGAELELETTEKFNNLINSPEYKSDPEALKGQLQSVIGSVASHIADDDIRAGFLAQAEKNSMHYVNQAISNRKAEIKEAQRKAEREQERAERKAEKEQERAERRAEKLADKAESRRWQLALREDNRRWQLALRDEGRLYSELKTLENREYQENKEAAKSAKAEEKAAEKDDRARYVKTKVTEGRQKLLKNSLVEDAVNNPFLLNSMNGATIANILAEIPDEDVRQDVSNELVPYSITYVAQASGRKLSEEKKARAAVQKERKQTSKTSSKSTKPADDAMIEVVRTLDELKYNDKYNSDISAYDNATEDQINKIADDYGLEGDEREAFIGKARKEVNKKEYRPEVLKNQDKVAKKQFTESKEIYKTKWQGTVDAAYKGIAENPEYMNNPEKIEQELSKFNKNAMEDLGKSGYFSEEEKTKMSVDLLNKKDALKETANKNYTKILNAQKRENAISVMDNAQGNISYFLPYALGYNGSDEEKLMVVQSAKNFFDAQTISNPDGSRMFSEAEILKQNQKWHKNLVDTVTGYYLKLDDFEKKTFLDDFGSGMVSAKGNGVQLFNAQDLADIRDFVTEDLKKNEKLLKEGYSEEEARLISTNNRLAHSNIKAMWDDMHELDKKGRVTDVFKGKTSIYDMLAFRQQVGQYLAMGAFSQDEAFEYLNKIERPILEIADNFNDDPFGTNTVLESAYRNLRFWLRGKNISDFTAGQKLFMLQGLYEQLNDFGIDPQTKPAFGIIKEDSSMGAAMKVAMTNIYNDFVSKTAGGTLNPDLQKKVDRVVAGLDVYDYGTTGKKRYDVGPAIENIKEMREEQKKEEESNLELLRRNVSAVANILHRLPIPVYKGPSAVMANITKKKGSSDE